MRLLRSALLAVLLSSGVLVTGGAGPALACSCAFQQPREHVQAADEVFAGTLVRMADPPRREVMSSSDPITYTLQVDAVYRGRVGLTAAFESAISGASCGLEGMEVDRRYVVFVSTDGSERTATSCGGTAPATPRLLQAVERLTGAPVPPAVVTEETPPAARGTRQDGPVIGAGSVWAVGGLGVAVLLGAGLLLRRRAAISGGRPRG